MQNYYELLGVPKTATVSQIKSVFKKLALKYHPDKNPNNHQAEDHFKTLNEAYQTLIDENRRWAYNQKINAVDQGNEVNQQPGASNFSTKGNATTYNKYSWTSPNSAAGDYSNQGRHYEEPIEKRKERKSDVYILGITLFIIIATGSLLFGLLMNKIAAKEHFETAIVNFDDKDYYNALMQLNLTIDFDNEHVKAHIMRGDINVKLNRFRLALGDYNRAIKYSDTVDNELVTKRDMCKLILESE
jgi:curved DNA-binding protein CbpA